MRRPRSVTFGTVFASIALVAIAAMSCREPADWGSDHVDRALPVFTTGDECLFCHRAGIGPNWPRNTHNRAVHAARLGKEPALEALRAASGHDEIVSEVEFVLGGGRRVVFLKSIGYGEVALLSSTWEAREVAVGGDRATGHTGHIVARSAPHWDETVFASRCAGCHMTAVDSKSLRFQAISLDCSVCHGAVDPGHTVDRSLILFSSSRARDARVVVSTCGQCHLRGGVSRSSGLPYPNNFVAGDNLLRDFRVDLSDAALGSLPVGERHIRENARDVVLGGDEVDEVINCVTCHDIHGDGGTRRHRRLEDSTLCESCHAGRVRRPERLEWGSAVCDSPRRSSRIGIPSRSQRR